MERMDFSQGLTVHASARSQHTPPVSWRLWSRAFAMGSPPPTWSIRWPAARITFHWYDSKLEVMKPVFKRQRNRLRDRLGLNDGPRLSCHCSPSSEFARCKARRVPFCPQSRLRDGRGDDRGAGGKIRFDRLVGTRKAEYITSGKPEGGKPVPGSLHDILRNLSWGITEEPEF